MDEFEAIRTLLTEDAPSEQAVTAGRERLRAERPAARRRLRIPPPVLAAGALTATVTATMLAVTALGSAPRAPDRPGPLVTGTARQVLLAAAQLQVPSGKGKYWYAEVDNRELVRVGSAADPYFVRISTTHRSVVPLASERGTAYIADVMSDWRIDPATPADREVWRRSGSPDSWTLPNGRCVIISDVGWCGKITSRRSGLGGGVGVLDMNRPAAADPEFPLGVGGTSMPLSELRRLPADAPALRRTLLRELAGIAGSPEDRLWMGGCALVTSLPVSAQVRAAAYRMLADLPGVRSLGTVRDPAGRPGTAVARTRPSLPPPDQPGRVSGLGPVEYRLIIDPATGRAQATELRLPRPAGEASGLPPGTVWSHSLPRSAGWTDRIPADLARLLATVPGPTAPPEINSSGGTSVEPTLPKPAQTATPVPTPPQTVAPTPPRPTQSGHGG